MDRRNHLFPLRNNKTVKKFVGVIRYYMLFTYLNKKLLVGFFFSSFFFKNVALAWNPQCPQRLFHPLEVRARVGTQPRLAPKLKSSPSAPSLRNLFLYGLLTFSFVNVKCLLHTAICFLSMKEKHQWIHWNLLS